MRGHGPRKKRPAKSAGQAALGFVCFVGESVSVQPPVPRKEHAGRTPTFSPLRASRNRCHFSTSKAPLIISNAVKSAVKNVYASQLWFL
jgi:hypothetical protein